MKKSPNRSTGSEPVIWEETEVKKVATMTAKILLGCIVQALDQVNGFERRKLLVVLEYVN